MIYTAILIAGLISAPTDCREHHMTIQTAMPTTAWVEANCFAAEWLLEHPEYSKESLKVLPGRGV